MAVPNLSSAAVLGNYIKAIETAESRSWPAKISNLFQDQVWETEIALTGFSSGFREWAGERAARELREHSVKIANVDYEQSISIHRRDMTQDKTGQVQVRLNQRGARAAQHWASLLTQLIVDGESSPGYDGSNFFHTAHVNIGDSGTQDNDLTANATSHTAPTNLEVETAIMDSIQAILGLVDEEGEPMNEDAMDFLIMVPVMLWPRFVAVVKNRIIQGDSGTRESVVANLEGFNVELRHNGRLDKKTGWANVGASTTKFATFRQDSAAKPLIRIQDMPPTSPGLRFTVLGEGSEHAKKTNHYLIGAECIRGAGYGHWQHACLYTWT